MSTWAIGDVHGCRDALRRLLDRIGFTPDRDRLWFVGDLVNRGPDTLATLRFVRDLGDAAICVLGNHDLHLLATAAGIRRRGKDRFDELLAAADRDELLDWLRRRALLHHDSGLGFTLVHAGLHPDWDLATARALAAELEEILRAPGYRRLFDYMYGDEPSRWSPDLTVTERHRLAINVFTRMRYCTVDGRIDLGPSGPPGSQPAGLVPWFEVPGRASADLRIVFGHWSSLGRTARAGVHGLDSGCCWGGALSALRLDDGEHLVQVECGRT